MASSLDAIAGTGESIIAPGTSGFSLSDYANRLSDFLHTCTVIHPHSSLGNRNYGRVLSPLWL